MSTSNTNSINVRRTRDLLLPRLFSGQIPLTTMENYANA